MNAPLATVKTELDALREQTATAARAFNSRYENEVAVYRHAIAGGINAILDDLRQEVERASDNNTVAMTVNQIRDYVHWLQWTLWDLPYFAVALRPPMDRFRRAVSACGLVYLSMRIVDDVLDRHFWYKGKHPTLLSVQTEQARPGQPTEALTVLAALLVCFQGLTHLSDGGSELAESLRITTQAVRAAVIGAIMEQSTPESWDRDYYQRLVHMKNVEYWRSLYAALDTDQQSDLYRLLERYYALAQMLNDIQDHPEDLRRQQPNLISIAMRADKELAADPANRTATSKAVPDSVEQALANEFLALGRMAGQLPEPERQIAQLKLNESLQEAERLGLFWPQEASVESTAAHEPLNLGWYAQLAEVIEHAGIGAVEEVNCPVCDTDERRLMFTKQGFSFHRCQGCSQIYVSPRVRNDVQHRIAEALGEEESDSYLEIQKIYAAYLCDYLHPRAPGPRLLDIGFGLGYLMQLTRAYGFEVYGIDSSRKHVEHLRAQFGDRVRCVAVGTDHLPWGGFDVVVMSHVLEHLGDPIEALIEVGKVMNPGGLVYIAVPDMHSVQFRIFGKHLDTVSPLVHFQYFSERSLHNALSRSGFDAIERVTPPSIPEEIAPRWMRLVSRLGGTDSGELAMVGRLPGRLLINAG